ncbi:hypothetical protein ABIC09_001227 [Bradyrhizobium sp. S3.12.5]
MRMGSSYCSGKRATRAGLEKFSASDELRLRARAAIPGGAHTYAKGDDQYPLLAPGFISRGFGSHVWDVDGNEFIEYGMGLRAVSLGHGFAPVVKAATEQLARGTNFMRPSPLEAECAERLIELVPGAEMAKIHQRWVDGYDCRDPACSRIHRPRHGRVMLQPSVLLLRRLGNLQNTDGRWHSRGCDAADARIPVQRPVLGRIALCAIPRPNCGVYSRGRKGGATCGRFSGQVARTLSSARRPLESSTR